MPIIPVADPSDPRLADYRDIRDGYRSADAHLTEKGAGPIFFAEGTIVLQQLARSRFVTRSILTTPGRLDAEKALLSTFDPSAPVYVIEQEVMDAITGFHIHRGLIAVGERAREHDFEDLARASPHLVLLEDIANHDNIGGIFRNVAALAPRGTGVVLSPRCADPLYRKALRVSAGHVLTVPFARAREWPGAITRLRELGFTSLALTPGEGSRSLLAFGAPERVAILLGTEGPGLSRTAAESAAARVRIPMASGVDSLNVGVACAVALHRLFPDPGKTEPPVRPSV